MKQRLLSMITVLALCLTLLPVAAFAAENDSIASAPLCICEEACKAETMNALCPVCGAVDAVETDCANHAESEFPIEEPTAAEQVQNMIEALPTAADVATMDEEQRDVVYVAAQETYDAFEALDSEEMAAVTNLTKLTALLDAFTETTETYADYTGQTLYLGGQTIAMDKAASGNGWSYDGKGTLTLSGYENNETLNATQHPLTYYPDTYFSTVLAASADLTIALADGTTSTLTTGHMKYESDDSGTLEKPRYTGIFSEHNITIRGNGTLVVNAPRAVWCPSTLTISDQANVTCTSIRDCMNLMSLEVKGGATVSATSTAPNLAFIGIRVANYLTVDNATVTGTSSGYYYSGHSDSPAGVFAGTITVNNGGKITGTNEYSGNKREDCLGNGIYCGVLTVNNGEVRGYSKNKTGGDGIHVQTTLTVGQRGYVYGETSNANKTDKTYFGGIKCDALVLCNTDLDPNAETVKTYSYITQPYLGTHRSSGTYQKGYIMNETDRLNDDGTLPALKAEITGIQRLSLRLWEFNKNNYYGYYDQSLGNAAGFRYSDKLDLDAEYKLGNGNIVMLRPSDCHLFQGIVVESGEHSITLPNYIYNLDGTYITVRSGATLNLYLTGNAIFKDTRQKDSDVATLDPLIQVEPGGKLNILNGVEGGNAFPSLSVHSTAAVPFSGGNGNNGYGTVSITGCVLCVRGWELEISNYRYDILANLEINSGAYVDANFGSSFNLGAGTSLAANYYPTLTMNGGSFKGKTASNGTITYDGTGGNLMLENTDLSNITVQKPDGTPLYRVQVTLYDTQNQFDKARRGASYYTNNSDMNEKTEQYFLLLKQVKTAKNFIYQQTTGGIPIPISNTAQHSTLTLYLEEGLNVGQATLLILDNGKEKELNYWSSAVDEEKIVAKSDNTGSGLLYVAGPNARLLMSGTIVLKSGWSSTDRDGNATNKRILQFASDYTDDDTAYWVDYQDIANTIGMASPKEGTFVTGFQVIAREETHKMYLDGLMLTNTTSCFTLTGRESNTGETWQDANLTLFVLNSNNSTRQNILDSTQNPIFDLSNGINNTLLIKSVEEGETSFREQTGGKLTLTGSKAFANAAGTNLTIDDMFLVNNCSDKSETKFKSLTFENSTVIGFGTVSAKDGITVNGGSVDMDVAEGTKVKNSNGTSLYKNVYTFTVEDAGNQTVSDLTIKGLYDGDTFDTSNITTDGDGKITLWLPSGAELTSAKLGGKLYYVGTTETGEHVVTTGSNFSITSPTTDIAILTRELLSETLTVTAFGVPSPSYQWYMSTDGGETWIKDPSVSFFGNPEYAAKRASFHLNLFNTQDGAKFKCEISNSYIDSNGETVNNKKTTPVFTVYKLTDFADDGYPTSQTVAAGSMATFTVKPNPVHSDLSVSYQWQRLTGEDSTRDDNWTDIDGATSATYSPIVTAEMNGWQLRCVVTYTAPEGTTAKGYTAGNNVQNAPAVLTVVKKPDITKQPQAVASKSGKKATFTLSATGDSLRYQWQSSDDSGQTWTNIKDATTDSYTVENATETMNGTQYRCMVTNTVNNIDNTQESNPATLTVVGLPIITAQPQDTRIYVKDDATFTVTATGNQSLAYQWYVQKTDTDGSPTGNFERIDGATAATYTVDNVTRDMNGWLYRCVVTNAFDVVSQQVTSEEATLTISHRPSSTYPVTTPSETENGTVSVDKKAPAAGETVTITPEPAEGYEIDQITVTDKNGNAIEVKANKDGSFSFVQPNGNVTIEASFKENAPQQIPFDDVSTASYFYDAVQWALEQNITTGVEQTLFGPDRPCTRAQLVTFLWRAVGQPAAHDATGFTDVDENGYYIEAVRWAAGEKIVEGYGNQLFGPDDTITREQVVTILHRFAVSQGMDVSVGEDTNILSYQDALTVSEYAIAAFQWACGSDIVQGYDGCLTPQAPCSRAQIVTMLYRLLGK